MDTIDMTRHPLPRGPWLRGAPVTLEEYPSEVPGFSLFVLAGSDHTFASLMDDCESRPIGFVLATLWRAIANISRVCPVCRARARLADGGGRMDHENACMLSDGAIREAVRAGLLDTETMHLPPRPRAWRVRPPKLTIKSN